MGAGGIPWVVALEGVADYECTWITLNGCIETMTCECAQQPRLSFEALDLHIRSVEAGPRFFSTPLGVVENSALAVAEGPDGTLVVVIASQEYDGSNPETRIRYVEVDTR
jgi:hypothetical protein